MLVWTLLILLLIYLDQLTKYLAVIFLKPVGSFPIIQDVFHFTYVENRGAAFGMLSDHRWVFMTISIIGIIALSIYLVKCRREGILQNIALSMIIAGGIGNMIDRFALGYVVDFFDFALINFAVFNVADVFVCVGCGLEVLFMIIMLVRSYKEAKLEASKPHEAPTPDTPKTEPDDAPEKEPEIEPQENSADDGNG